MKYVSCVSKYGFRMGQKREKERKELRNKGRKEAGRGEGSEQTMRKKARGMFSFKLQKENHTDRTAKNLMCMARATQHRPNQQALAPACCNLAPRCCKVAVPTNMF